MSDKQRLSVKSKLGAEIRRFPFNVWKATNFDEFKTELERLHCLSGIPFFIYYIDPTHGDLLPINNNDNFGLALANCSANQRCLKLHLQTKGESWIQTNGSGKKKNFFDNINNLLPLHSNTDNRKLHISFPLEDFRQVSSIIDVDIVPETCRRVRLVKHGSDKPLGFYIRDGTSVRVTVSGLEKVPGIFISRLVPGGLAESTGLLSVNDEVLEVNGIEVLGKSLDQVTDMMVANSSNLIITIRPANQRNPFQYPKLPQQQSFNSIQQQPLQSGSHHRNDHREEHRNDHRNDHLNEHRTFSNNHSAPGSSKQPPGDVKHKTAISQQTASSQQQTNQRIPRNNTDNTPASTHKSSQFYLGAENHDKVPSLRTSLSAGCLGAANLAEGEDTSDEEDEVKHHFQPNDLNKNDFNKNGDGPSKTLVQATPS